MAKSGGAVGNGCTTWLRVKPNRS